MESEILFTWDPMMKTITLSILNTLLFNIGTRKKEQKRGT